MKSIYVLLVVSMILMPVKAYSQGKDPFARLLPRPEDVQTEASDEQPESFQAVALPSDLALQGVFWGVRSPQVIINGKVYGEKEKLKGTDIEVIKIENGGVHLLYGKRIFVLYPSTNAQ